MNNYFNRILNRILDSVIYVLIAVNVVYWTAFFHLLIDGGVA